MATNLSTTESHSFIEPKQVETQTSGFSEIKKKAIGVGILAILIVSMVVASSDRESPSIGWMLALSASWGLFVWMLPNSAPLAVSKMKRVLCIGAASLAVFAAIAIGAEASFSKWRSEKAELIKSTEAMSEAVMASEWMFYHTLKGWNNGAVTRPSSKPKEGIKCMDEIIQAYRFARINDRLSDRSQHDGTSGN